MGVILHQRTTEDNTRPHTYMNAYLQWNLCDKGLCFIIIKENMRFILFGLFLGFLCWF